MQVCDFPHSVNCSYTQKDGQSGTDQHKALTCSSLSVLQRYL